MRNQLILFILLFTLPLFSQINPDKITIIRDQWGVPHIYAKTDAEVAYGLAWASAEDDFETIQETLLPIRGKLGIHEGVKGAVLDFAVQVIDVNPIVDAKYETDISPEFRKIAEAYAAGMNRYAALHPKEVLVKDLFPVDGKDVVKSYVLALTLLSGAATDLGRIVTGNISLFEDQTPMGSNAFALNSKKTSDGQTYLAINPHQPLEGAYSWYEAHLVSEEGLNILGATLIGGMHVFVGVNENLAWTHTVNHADMMDVYKLEMHRFEENKYWLDGKWETLEERNVKLKVKVLGVKLGVKRKLYRSKHGTVIKSKNGNYYAIRFPSNHTVGGAEQWYMMNKAKNFQEFKTAISRLGVCTTNLMYADNQDNIFYAGLGLFPKRNPKYDWQNVLPGYTSEVIWASDFHSFEELVQYHNPPSGYLSNCNHSPFEATTPEYNVDPATINSTFGYMTGNNNRSLRYHDLINEKEKISYDEFKKIKFDTKWHNPAHVYSFTNLELLLNLDAKKYPHLAECITYLNDWNRETDINNIGATMFNLTYHYLHKDLNKRGQFPTTYELKESEIVTALGKTKKHLKKYFKTIKVPLGEAQQHVRGKKSIPSWGGPNVLAAMYGKPNRKGRFKIFAGESYVSLVRFAEEGVQIETIVPYGTSNHKDSPHYDDQMEMYMKHELKKMTLNKDEIIKKAERTYHPE